MLCDEDANPSVPTSYCLLQFVLKVRARARGCDCPMVTRCACVQMAAGDAESTPKGGRREYMSGRQYKTSLNGLPQGELDRVRK